MRNMSHSSESFMMTHHFPTWRKHDQVWHPDGPCSRFISLPIKLAWIGFHFDFIWVITNGMTHPRYESWYDSCMIHEDLWDGPKSLRRRCYVLGFDWSIFSRSDFLGHLRDPRVWVIFMSNNDAFYSKTVLLPGVHPIVSTPWNTFFEYH